MNDMHKVAISMKIIRLQHELQSITNPLRRKQILQKIDVLQLKAKQLTT